MVRVQHKFGGMRDEAYNRGGCGIREILKTGCGMKIERRDRDMLHLEGGIRDWTGIGGIRDWTGIGGIRDWTGIGGIMIGRV